MKILRHIHNILPLSIIKDESTVVFPDTDITTSAFQSRNIQLLPILKQHDITRKDEESTIL